MPFDAAPQTNPEALYRERRERAAALWRSVPPDRFDMTDWRNECGTTACALGWLAAKQVDGWELLGNNWNVPMRGRLGPVPAAAEYFGITFPQAKLIFVVLTHGVTAKRLARTLLALPVTIPAGDVLRSPH